MIEWIMMVAFLAAVLLSGWKLYHFLPNQPLADDDRTEAAREELTALMLEGIASFDDSQSFPSPQELYKQITALPSFDRERYWRFNENRLNQLLQHYYLKHPDLSSIEDIYHSLQ